MRTWLCKDTHICSSSKSRDAAREQRWLTSQSSENSTGFICNQHDNVSRCSTQSQLKVSLQSMKRQQLQIRDKQWSLDQSTGTETILRSVAMSLPINMPKYEMQSSDVTPSEVVWVHTGLDEGKTMLRSQCNMCEVYEYDLYYRLHLAVHQVCCSLVTD